jgi:hypothetical protein
MKTYRAGQRYIYGNSKNKIFKILSVDGGTVFYEFTFSPRLPPIKSSVFMYQGLDFLLTLMEESVMPIEDD